MDTLSVAEMYVAYTIGYLDDDGVTEWAQEYAQDHPEITSDSQLYRLLWLNPRRKDESQPALPQLLDEFVRKEAPAFDLKSGMSESIAKVLFEGRLKEYLAGSVSPWSVCRMVSPIEQLYDFPDWLGGMYDACDWIEPDTQRNECPGLEAEINRHLVGR